MLVLSLPCRVLSVCVAAAAPAIRCGLARVCWGAEAVRHLVIGLYQEPHLTWTTASLQLLSGTKSFFQLDQLL